MAVAFLSSVHGGGIIKSIKISLRQTPFQMTGRSKPHLGRSSARSRTGQPMGCPVSVVTKMMGSSHGWLTKQGCLQVSPGYERW